MSTTITPKTYHQSNIQALCIFCYKSCNQDYQNGKSRTKEHQFVVQVQARFFQMVERYFEYKRALSYTSTLSPPSPSFGKLGLPLGEGEDDWRVGCCSDCFNIIDSYCDMYHKMKVLELELDRKLDTLSNIMTYAERVPSRISGYRDWCLRERLDMEKSMKFRRKFQKECVVSARRSFPKIRLIRKQAQEVTATDIVTSVQDNILTLQTTQCQESEIAIDPASLPESPISAVALDCMDNQSNQENVPSPSPSDTDNRRLELDLTSIKISLSPSKQLTTDTSKACYPVPQASIKVSHSPDEETSDFPSPPVSPEPEVSDPFVKRIKLSSPEATVSTGVSRITQECERSPEERLNHEKFIEESPRRRKIRQLSKCTICNATFSAPAKLEKHISEVHQSSHSRNDNGDDDYGNNMDKDTADDDWVADDEYFLQTDIESERESQNKPENIRKSSPMLDLTSESHENQEAGKEAAKTFKKGVTTKNMTQGIEAVSAPLAPRFSSTIKPNGSFACTKCPEIYFGTLLKFRAHHNYMHTNGHHKMTKMEFYKILRLRHKSVKLQGVKSLQMLKCQYRHQATNKCLTEFMLEQELKNHMEYHEQVKCETCGEEMDNVVNMVGHEIEHFANDDAEPGRLICGKCSFTAVHQGELINHYLEIHRNKPGLQATCPICRHEFKYVEKVPMLHYVNYHDLTRLDNPSSSGITCTAEACTAYFLTEDQLQQHCSSVHVKKSMEILDREKKIALKKRKRDLRIKKRKLAIKQRGNQCDGCQSKFSDEKHLKHHQLLSCSSVSRKKLEEYGRIQLTEDGMTIDDFINGRNCGSFACKICAKIFELEEHLEKHTKLHGDYKCNFCDVIKTHATEIAIHETVHNVGKTNNIDNSSFQCPRCKFKTQRRSIYIKHHVETHLGMEMESDQKQCPICKTPVTAKKESWTTPRNLFLFHYFEYHDKNNLDYETMPKCNQCQAYFRTDFQLEKHLKKIHGVDKCQCGTCGKVFGDWPNLRKHRKNTHKVDESAFEFVCDFPDCGRKFEFEMERNSHKRTSHSLGAMQRCKECGRTFVGSHQLRLHMTTHEEKKDIVHVCEECGKVFTTNLKLYNHTKIHKNISEKKYVCKICSKVCSTGGKLREHSRTHTQEKPFVCQMCGSSYAHAHNLRIHMKSKHQDQD